jgi:uncharacterized membrane protein (UPF0127 family)
MSCEPPVPGSERTPVLARIRIGAALGVAMIVATTPLAAELPTVELAIKRHRVVAEVAATNAARTTGLMNRFSLRPDHGMLFVFKEPQPQAFWMKNTYVPLSIAFIGSDGKILNIEDMAPLTESTHPSRGAALYALEMKKGWFTDRGIRPGDGVAGLERSPKAIE